MGEKKLYGIHRAGGMSLGRLLAVEGHSDLSVSK